MIDEDDRFPQPQRWGRIETRDTRLRSALASSFPQPQRWGRIETVEGIVTPLSHRVSPSLSAGGGLKQLRTIRALTFAEFPPASALGAD